MGEFLLAVSRLLILPLLILLLAAPFPASAQSCDFTPVKQEIDRVLARDTEKLKTEVKSGADSLDVVSTLASAPMREKIDICRFEASEYLAKRGFPPGAH